MDLVDIDQVLDNLELLEAAGENNKAVVPRALTNTAATDVCSSNGCGANALMAPSTSTANSSSSSYNKSFVGVSQVFNSLNDYRKNVESLESASVRKYDEECKLIANIVTVQEHSSKASCEAQDDEVDHAVNHLASTTVDCVRNSEVFKDGDENNHYDDDDYADDDDDEDEATNDLQKFTESCVRKRNNDPEDITTTTMSDSLTTSSSSTFSSGTSPGFASTTEEQSTPFSPAEFEDQYEETKAEPSINNPPAQVAVIGSKLNKVAEAVGTKEIRQPTTGLDDLAVGLSSISINSANTHSGFPREITVSSALVGLLDELSATTTTSLLSQMRDKVKDNQIPLELDADSKSSFVSPYISFPDCDSMKEPQKNMNGEVGIQVKVKPLRTKGSVNDPFPQKDQQPITFGSTMDEISDTELDSMLQEMDIDDAPEQPPKKSGVLGKSEESVSSDVVAPHPVPQQHVANGVDENEGVVCSVDQINADSFSQASTVEFSEIRSQQNQQIQNEFEQSTNSLESSYSSSDSSLAGEISGARNDGADGHNQSRPKRPTTLDLPVMKVNLYANAGQTPPGSNIPQSDAELESSEDPNDELVLEERVISDICQQPNMGEDAFTSDNDAVTHLTQPIVEPGVGHETDESIAIDLDGSDGAPDITEATGYSDPHENLGKIPPIWVPDNMASACMQCHVKFTMIKRRHHCRACGKVLCSLCCSQKFNLEFLASSESRVCVQCFLILTHRQQAEVNSSSTLKAEDFQTNGGCDSATSHEPSIATTPSRSPNPNNPMEYCSTIPPHRQVSNASTIPPSVIVPVGVLKKEGSNSSISSNSSNKKGRKRKSVMFSDGIAPGSDLASMENQWSDAKHARRQQQSDKQRNNSSGHKVPTPSRTESLTDTTLAAPISSTFKEGKILVSNSRNVAKSSPKPALAKRLPPSGCDENGCFIPKGDHCLPPISITKGDNSCEFDYKDVANSFELVERLQRETLKFAVQKNFFVFVKIVCLKCCMNKTVINFTTCGMHQVGNDEIVLLLEYEPPANKSELTEPPIPKDIFVHLNEIYTEAEKCNPIAELSFTMPQQSNFLGSRDYGGFLYIRATFQCLQDVIMPESPFLIAVLIHRYEVPWAKVFPLRLMLRLGAQYRYYPCPHISIRDRASVYAEIAQTIINFLADFRNYTYTLPSIKGMYIHMEDRQTSVLIPRNRYDDVVKAINNSSDHILAFGGNFSKAADGHLVCIQNTNDDRSEMYSYSTQAINIQGQPRKVTGASFFVLNEALKSTSGLSGKCSIVEDGLMVQILPKKMEEVRNALKNTKDIDIVCGPLDADEQQTEIVSIKWVDNDRDFGIGVKSPIDSMTLEGVSGMRVHASFNFSNANYSIRLTEIYMIKCDDSNHRMQALDITRISEQLARSTSVALLPFLDLLAANGSMKIGLRATLHQENVCYEAGTRSTKLPPLYMNALDNHLIPTLHNESSGIEDAIVLELIFYILNV